MTRQIARTLSGQLRVLGRPAATSPGTQVRDRITEITASAAGAEEEVFTVGTTQPLATNTGIPVGGALVDSNGHITLTTGQTLEGKTVKGQITVNGSPTIRFNKIEGKTGLAYAEEGLIVINSGSPNIYQNEIAQTASSQIWYMNGIKVKGGTPTIHRNDIHDVLDGVYVNAGTITAIGNYIHDFMFRTDDNNQNNPTYSDPLYWSHNDGFQIRGGSNHLIRGNYIRGTFSDVTGMPATANPSGTPYRWRNNHLILAQGSNGPVVNLQIQDNWFAYGAIGIQWTTGTSNGNSSSMSGNRICPNQALEFSQYRQFLIDKPGTVWTVTGVGSTVYMDHPDTPSLIVGQPLNVTGGRYYADANQQWWGYSPSSITPNSPTGPVKPFV